MKCKAAVGHNRLVLLDTRDLCTFLSATAEMINGKRDIALKKTTFQIFHFSQPVSQLQETLVI